MNHATKEKNSFLMDTFQWITNLFYLNILWFIGCLSGLVIAGIGPATISLFETLKELSWRDNKVPLTRTFFKIYKEQWLIINKWMIVLYGVTIFFWIDYRLIILFNFNTLIFKTVYPLFILLVCIVTITIIYFFAFYTNFNLPVLKKLDNSLLLAFSSPIRSLLIILFLVVHYIIILRWPFILIFFMVSLPAFIIILILKKVYFKIIWSANQNKESMNKTNKDK